uniref:Uncharacterized protein n=2 Tax=Odontella aurita TaxID=265563 RepID=A0A7S4I6N0_9STRA|mmetsp:Transcript_20675/g.60097  ORF Transcript_20675/g.60097 Transcript_20675/m.60097 type:complete len:473 (+) Transcript_20675:287-1705(+)
MNHGTQGDNDPDSRIDRNLKERAHHEGIIGSASLDELVQMIDFFTKLSQPVVSWTSWYIDKLKGCPSVNTKFSPHPRQWIARRRIHWMQQLFRKRIETLISNGRAPRSVTRRINGALDKFKCEYDVESIQILQHVHTHRGESFACALVGEMREELLHLASKDLQPPYITSIWCPIASELFKEAMCNISASLLCHDPVQVKQEKLLDRLLTAASKSASLVRKCARSKDLSLLAFRPSKFGGVSCSEAFIVCLESSVGADGGEIVLVDEDLAHESNTSSYCRNVASLLQKQKKGAFVATSCFQTDSEISNSESDTTNAPTVDESWYIINQIVFVVHSLAVNCVKWETSETNDNRMKMLCDAVGLKPNCVLKAFEAWGGEPRAVKERPKEYHNKRSFRQTIWEALRKEGWSIQHGSRPTDMYFCPPGVERKAPFVNRRDYFDSVSQVIQIAKTDTKWKDRSIVIEAVHAYYEQIS